MVGYGVIILQMRLFPTLSMVWSWMSICARGSLYFFSLIDTAPCLMSLLAWLLFCANPTCVMSLTMLMGLVWMVCVCMSVGSCFSLNLFLNSWLALLAACWLW